MSGTALLLADHYDVPDRLHSVPHVGERVEDGIRPDFCPYNLDVDAIYPPGDGGDGFQLLIVVGEPCPVVLQPALEPTP